MSTEFCLSKYRIRGQPGRKPLHRLVNRVPYCNHRRHADLPDAPLTVHPDPPRPPPRRSPSCSPSAALLALGASSALADAGNPIIGTTKGDLVQNPDGTVTAYVRGAVELALPQQRLQLRPRRHRPVDDLERPDRDRLHADQNGQRPGRRRHQRTAAGPTPTRSTAWSTRSTAATSPKACPGSPNRPSANQTFNDPAPQAAGQPHPTAPGAVAAGASRSTTPTPTPGTPGAPGAMRSQAKAPTATPTWATPTSTARATSCRNRSA